MRFDFDDLVLLSGSPISDKVPQGLVGVDSGRDFTPAEFEGPAYGICVGAFSSPIGKLRRNPPRKTISFIMPLVSC